MSEAFAFNAATEERAQTIVARYPEGRQQSAVIPLLDLAQRQAGGWLPTEVIEYVASYLDMPKIRVLEVATFYSMFNLEPVGENFVQLCRTTPCWLRGSDEIVGACKKFLGVEIGETTEDGMFTLSQAECLGACVNAPMMQIGDDYYEDLDAETTMAILRELKAGKTPKTGSQNGRFTCEPAGGLTSLEHQKDLLKASSKASGGDD